MTKKISRQNSFEDTSSKNRNDGKELIQQKLLPVEWREISEEEKLDKLRNEDVAVDVLEVLAKSSSLQIRGAVALHKNTTQGTLKKLAEGFLNSTSPVFWNNKNVKKVILYRLENFNLNLPDEWHQIDEERTLEKLNAEEVSVQVLEILAMSTNAQIRTAVALHKNTPQKIRDQLIEGEDCWYELYFKPIYLEEISDLNPESFKLKYGQTRYKIKLPVLLTNPSKSNKKFRMEIDDICKSFKIKTHYYEYFRLFINNKEIEHPRNRTTTNAYELPVGKYYIGDPSYVLDGKSIELFWKHDGENCFLFRGTKVVCINTGGDGYFRVYEFNEDGDFQFADSDEMFDGPVLLDSIPVDTANIAIIPTKILNMSEEELAENGYILELEAFSEKEEENTFSVIFHNHFRNGFCAIEYVEMAGTHILISDQNLYSDEDE